MNINNSCLNRILSFRLIIKNRILICLLVIVFFFILFRWFWIFTWSRTHILFLYMSLIYLLKSEWKEKRLNLQQKTNWKQMSAYMPFLFAAVAPVRDPNLCGDLRIDGSLACLPPDNSRWREKCSGSGLATISASHLDTCLHMYNYAPSLAIGTRRVLPQGIWPRHCQRMWWFAIPVPEIEHNYHSFQNRTSRDSQRRPRRWTSSIFYPIQVSPLHHLHRRLYILIKCVRRYTHSNLAAPRLS